MRKEIKLLTQGVVLPEIRDLDEVARKAVRRELEAIMAVYGDACPIERESDGWQEKKQRLGNLVFKASSTIHGTGLFAKVDINKGQQIGTYEGPTAKRDGTYVLWVFEEGEEPVGRSGRNLLRYLNHEDEGNAEFDGFDLFALRDINTGDEITFDYGGWEEE